MPTRRNQYASLPLPVRLYLGQSRLIVERHWSGVRKSRKLVHNSDLRRQLYLAYLRILLFRHHESRSN